MSFANPSGRHLEIWRHPPCPPLGPASFSIQNLGSWTLASRPGWHHRLQLPRCEVRWLVFEPSNLKRSTGISHTRSYQYVYQLLYLSILTCSNYSLDQIRWQKYTNSSSGIFHRNRWHPGRIVAGLWHQRLFWRWQGKYPSNGTDFACHNRSEWVYHKPNSRWCNQPQPNRNAEWEAQIAAKRSISFLRVDSFNMLQRSGDSTERHSHHSPLCTS